MTDTIGWGDVDVETRRRRRPRLSRPVAWSAAAVIAAAFVLVPRAESHLADSAAAWLQREWRTASSYDEARQHVLSQASEHAAQMDGQLFSEVLAAVDREESQHLTAIAAAVAGHRSWSGDVHRAAVAASRALAAQAHDLLAQAAHPQAFFSSSFYVAAAETGSTYQLVAAADRLVAASARRHHARLPRTSEQPRLTAAASELRQLERVTDEPLALRLAVQGTGGIDVWNLSTGAMHRLSQVAADDDIGQLHRVGTSLLLQSSEHWLLVPTAAGTTVRLPAAADYLPAGEHGLWQVDGAKIRLVDDSGRARSRTYAAPAGYDAPFTAGVDSLILTRSFDPLGNDATPVVWTPADGRVRPLSGACDADAGVAGHTVAYLRCAEPGDIAVLDTRSGVIRRLPVPRGLQVLPGGLLLSPDGRRIAVQLVERGVDDPARASLAVVDVATGHVQLLTSPSWPVAWSVDGAVLVVNVNVNGADAQTSEPLAYWTGGGRRLAPIRIPLTDVNTVLAALPLS